MKKICMLFAMLMASVSFTFTSCSKDDEVDKNENGKYKKGEYVVTVTQIGDISKYIVTSNIMGECDDLKGVYDTDGVNKGLTYDMSEAEAKRMTYSYKTNKNGYWMTFTTLFKPADENAEITVPLIVTVTFSFNGKVIGEEVFTETGQVHQVSSFDFDY